MSPLRLDATTRAAYDPGLKCTLIHDACATRDLEFRGKQVKAEEVRPPRQTAAGRRIGRGHRQVAPAQQQDHLVVGPELAPVSGRRRQAAGRRRLGQVPGPLQDQRQRLACGSVQDNHSASVMTLPPATQ
jgi:hypothetical protein